MEAGKLDRRVTIQRAAERDDGFATVSDAFADVGTVWAEKIDLKATERVRAQQVGADITTRFRMRWNVHTRDLTPKDRLFCEGRTYDIAGVIEIGRREGVEALGAARIDQGTTP